MARVVAPLNRAPGTYGPSPIPTPRSSATQAPPRTKVVPGKNSGTNPVVTPPANPLVPLAIQQARASILPQQQALEAQQADGPTSSLLLTNRAIVGLGLISYSLYLWHVPILMLANALGADRATRAAVIPASLAVAFLSYRYIEQPFRHRRPAWWHPGRSRSSRQPPSLRSPSNETSEW
jgi:hypothetical protein